MLLPLFPLTTTLPPVPTIPVQEAIVYEVNLRAFGPGSNFAAVTSRLDDIRALGTNVLWLMPIQPVGKVRSAGGLGSPYAVADYDRVNPEFGTDADLRRLIAEAHRREMRVIIDWVPNHTAWDHPWIKNREWYTRDAKGEITIPAGTNWQDVADLDYGNVEMRKAMITAMKGWITRFGIDGFRCDVADSVPADFWRQAIPQLRKASPKPLLMLAEGARPDHYASGFDLTYGWEFYYRLKEAFAGGKATAVALADQKEKAAARSGAGPLRFTSNHDFAAWDGTPLEFFKTAAGVRTAFVAAALSGGAPLVYTGQEVAWSKRIPIFERSSVDWGSDPGTRKWVTDLFRLRSRHPALRGGTTTYITTDDIFGFRRRSGREEAIVLANVRDRPVTADIPPEMRGAWTDGFTAGTVRLSEKMALPAHGSRVFIRNVPKPR